MFGDALIIISTSVLASAAYQLAISAPIDFMQFAGLGTIAATLFIALGKNDNLYDPAQLLNLKLQARHITVKWIGVFLFLTAIGFAMKSGSSFSRGATLSFEFSALAMLIGARIGWRIVLADGLAVRKFSGRKIALLADEESASDSGILEALSRHGLQLAHHFVLPARSGDERAREDIVNRAIAAIRGSDIEEVLVSADLNRWPELSSVLGRLRVLPIPVNLVPLGPTSELFRLPSRAIGETITIELQRGPRTLLERFVKRVFDIAVAAAAILCFLPLIIITAIAIKLDSPGPILFRQRRSGFNGREFQIFKFRTMTVLEDGGNVAQATRNDSRVTRTGKILRRTSIDELPQLFNVLRGEMSVVGPRPHAMAHDDQFSQIAANYAFRHHVKPGITGWAQVHGFRGGMRTVTDIEQRIKFDLWYIDNWSLALDMKVIMMTLIEVVRGDNAY